MGHAFRERLNHDESGSIHVIQPADITNDGQIEFSMNEPLRIHLSQFKPLVNRDILLVNRGRFAAAVFDQKDENTWIVPSSIIVISVNINDVIPEYVSAFINSQSGQRLLQRYLEMSTIPFISASNLKNMKIPLPPMKQQKEIASLNQAIVLHEKLGTRKRELYRSLLNNEFGVNK